MFLSDGQRGWDVKLYARGGAGLKSGCDGIQWD